MRKSGLVLVAVAVFCFVAFAQKPAATGTVTGHVTCADTNTPARLAIVVLRPVPAAKSADSAAASKPVEARRGQTLLDGTFSIPSVAPGTYFVLASMAGYISPLAVLGFSNEDLLEPTGELRKRIAASGPARDRDGDCCPHRICRRVHPPHRTNRPRDRSDDQRVRRAHRRGLQHWAGAVYPL